MNVNIAIERSLDIPAPFAKVQALFADLEGTIRRFPKLKRLHKLGDRAYLWEMETIGLRMARIAHDVSYGAHYEVNLDQGDVRWRPIPNHGNATIEGGFKLKDQGRTTRMTFRVKGELRDVPVPLLYRVAAPAFIQGKFTRLVDVFLENTAAAATGVGRPSGRRKESA
jgi:hypothetical protein